MKKKEGKKRWYSVSFLGGLVLGLYGLVPPYIVYADNLGILSDSSRAWAIGGMSVVTCIVLFARKRGHVLFSRHRKDHPFERGFTLMELLVVISIIGILAALLLPFFGSAQKAAYSARAKTEFKSIAAALELYANSIGGQYPPDANRSIPPGVEAYLASGDWPAAPWPGSVYDWDAWAPGDLSYGPQNQVYQISVRFCPLDQPSACKFPEEEWAEDFDYYSSVYYCISGPCRAHSSKPIDHPGYCINC